MASSNDDDLLVGDGLKINESRLNAHSSQVEVVEDAMIVVTQAYDHKGNPLITEDNPSFQGFPGVHLKVRAAGKTHDVFLSPIHGHHERIGGDAIPAGTKCSVLSPQTEEELMAYAPCTCGKGTLRAIFLTPDLGKSHVAAVCDVWGCQRSRIVDEWEILSEFVYAETAGLDG